MYRPPTIPTSTFARAIDAFFTQRGHTVAAEEFWKNLCERFGVTDARCARIPIDTGYLGQGFKLERAAEHKQLYLGLWSAQDDGAHAPFIELMSVSGPFTLIDSTERYVLGEVRERSDASMSDNTLYCSRRFEPPLQHPDFSPLLQFEKLCTSYRSWQQSHRFELGIRAKHIVDGFERPTTF